MKPIDVNSPETKSADLVGSNLEVMKSLFPQAFSEGQIDFDALKQLLGGSVDEREEKYGLNWHGKRQARQLSLTPSTGTLRPVPKDSVDWDSTQNLMIEGDNLEVLKLLQKSYAGKVKMIYIDPPYNTGKDFVYKDDFRDSIGNYQRLTGQLSEDGTRLTTNSETSGRFHTEWLNMMYPRLSLAKNLLSEDGVILISIDDHELDNLKLLLNELLGEENFIANLIWEKGRKNDARLFSVGHEYMLLYGKSVASLRARGTIWREEKPGAREIWNKYLSLREEYGGDDEKIQDSLEKWFSELPRNDPSKKWSRYRRVDKNGPWRDRDISGPGREGGIYEVLHPVTGLPCAMPEGGWRYAKPETMSAMIARGLVEFRADHTEPPFRKAHLRPVQEELVDETSEGDNDGFDNEHEDVEELATQVRGSYFYKQSQVAVKALRSLFGKKVFNNPKDYFELARLFSYVTANDQAALFLDFFAGSGSSGEAVMDLNARDNGSRRFIQVQIPQSLDSRISEQKAAATFLESVHKPTNIAELSKERLRRGAAKVRAENPRFEGDLGFRVFKLDSTNIRPWEIDRDRLSETLEESVEHIKVGRTEIDVLYEVLQKLGLELTVPIQSRPISEKVVHSVGTGTLMVCLSVSISADEAEPLALGIVKWHKELAPAVETMVVFRDSAFADDVAKTNLFAILAQHGLENVRSL